MKVQGKKEELVASLSEFLFTPDGFNKASNSSNSKLQSLVAGINIEDLTEGVTIAEITRANSKGMEQNSTTNGSSPKAASNLLCICDNISPMSEENLIQCTTCQKFQHRDCMKANVDLPEYECILCQAKMINPFDEVMDVFCHPFGLEPTKQAGNEGKKKKRSFMYQSSTKTKIHSAAGKYQIQIRCLKLDGIGYEHTWPKWGKVSVNSREVMEFKMPDNPNARKRKDDAINITTLCQIGMNEIEFSMHSDPADYAVVILMIRRVPHAELSEQIRESCVMGYEEAKVNMLKSLRPSEEGDIQIVSDFIELKLKCPITMKPMQTPVRGSKCNHQQCFNLETYLETISKTRMKKWMCPYCKSKVFRMCVDPFVKEILAKSASYQDVVHAKIYPSGDYEIKTLQDVKKELENKTQPLESKSKSSGSKRVLETIAVDGMNTQVPNSEKKRRKITDRSSSRKANASGKKVGSGGTKQAPVVLLDSDEEKGVSSTGQNSANQDSVGKAPNASRSNINTVNASSMETAPMVDLNTVDVSVDTA
eukprot:CAMPEP_0115012466 /NCGR_PEP_ID=MMETSP0216-20121206/24752_1 /TAXON_ID=223996 /ORGANISM="Protocruzia adherens, Strain Boccale" /LENGTH=535 /DNA_ID=CAMNT_0002381525 /DNA_START=56 /DNA_END=1660 /DNA_ORIENTATION=+